MYLIAGLGNPTKEYADTRHNIGFDVIDVIAKMHGIPVLEKKHRAIIGKGYINGCKVILAKPQTYMNLSGESIKEIVNYYKMEADTDLVVIYDDVSLPLGQLRIRKKGSAGGHNGMKSIIAGLGQDVFPRIKMGVGEKPKEYDLADYVLGHFTQKERKVMDESARKAADAVSLILKGELDAAMNAYNKKQAE